MPSPGPRWGIAVLLAALPLLVRLVQSVKRFADSGLVTHLINVRPIFVVIALSGGGLSVIAGAGWEVRLWNPTSSVLLPLAFPRCGDSTSISWRNPLTR